MGARALRESDAWASDATWLQKLFEPVIVVRGTQAREIYTMTAQGHHDTPLVSALAPACLLAQLEDEDDNEDDEDEEGDGEYGDGDGDDEYDDDSDDNDEDDDSDDTDDDHVAEQNDMMMI